MKAFHLVTDLDGTWLPETPECPSLRALEALVADRTDRILTFATGRTLTSTLSVLEALRLHPPSHLITDVGAALYHRGPVGSWVEDGGWRDRVAGLWPDREALDALLACLPDLGLEPQPGLHPVRRLALEVGAGNNLADAVSALKRTCQDLRLRVHILPSHGRYVDLLPPGIHKGAALAYLQVRGKLPRPIIACGDSENDFGLLEAADLPILMHGSPVRDTLPASIQTRVRLTSFPGPEGIHQLLLAFGILEEGHHGH